MGRKRAREADGQASEGANPDIDKMDQDESSDDEVSFARRLEWLPKT